MNFSDNPEYKEVFELKRPDEKSIRFYIPVNTAEGYHVSRHVAANAQQIYSLSGATAEIVATIAQEIIKICNDTKKHNSQLRTDIALLANNLLYRTKYPVDQDCAIRMGAIYIFMEGEDPTAVINDAWTRRKVDLARDNPDLYTFFLSVGIKYTKQYRELLEALNEEDYFKTRMDQLKIMELNQ